MGSKRARSNGEGDSEEEPLKMTFQTTSFYGGNVLRKKNMCKTILATERRLEQSKKKPLPQDIKGRICGPTSKWSCFQKQADAIEEAKRFREGVMVFAFEGDAVGDAGKRNFVVAHPLVMWTRQKGRAPRERCSYEVIQEHSVCKLYFDLEFLYNSNPGKNGSRMVNVFISIVCHFLSSIFLIPCTRKQILDLDSTTNKKFSRHLIFNLEGVAFASNAYVGNFVSMICSKIRAWKEKKEVLEVPDVNLKDIESLFCKDSKDRLVLFCDEGVYTRNRNFRLYLSTKYGKDIPLHVAKENEYIPRQIGQEHIFLDSLVTLVPEASRILTFGKDSKRVQRKDISENIEQKASKIEGVASSPYQEVDEFIQSIIGKGYIRQWYYFSHDELIMYEIALYRYCHNIGREHKSNGIMYIVRLKDAMYYQKCHDPDCQGFRSDMWKLPDNTLPWRNMLDEEESIDGKDLNFDDGNDEIFSVIADKYDELGSSGIMDCQLDN